MTDPWAILWLSLAATTVGLFVPGGWAARLRPRADHRVACGASVALVSLATNLAVAGLNGLPRPHVNDEYGYLLIADTLLHGRLSNPTPADPDAFASPHVLLRPTYTAKYPPAQGVALAVGQAMGRPVLGVWITCGLATAAVYWMLLTFVPNRWALLGGLVAAVQPQLVAWGHVYWGGGVAVLGGALVVGAWGRLMRDEAPGVHPGLLLGVGLIVLANSRPYEGFVLSVPLVGALGWRWTRTVAGEAATPARAIVAAGSVLLLGGTLMVLYNVRVTGHTLRLPMMAYADLYDVAPKFWLLPLRSPVPSYPNDTLAWMHARFEVGEYRLWQTLNGATVNSVRRLVDGIWTFAQPGVLLVPFAFAVGRRGDPRTRWAWITLGAFVLGLGLETFYLRHYAAPAFGLVLLLVTLGWRRLHGWSPRLARALVIGYAVGAAVSAAGVDRNLTNVGQQALPEAVPALRQGRHLIFVRYAADHLPHDEWVYDGADPASQPLLWVRSRNSSADRAVVRDYPGRQVWLLTVGRHDIAPARYAP